MHALSHAVPAPGRTLADVLVPDKGLVAQGALIVAGSLIVALAAQVVVRLPFTPVPITGQTYRVLLVGALLGSRRGALSLALYLGEGAVGLPFFAGGAAGTPLGPTGGYLVGFAVAACVVGWLAERGWDRRPGTALLAMALGEAALYAVALSWLAHFVGPSHVLALGLLPFLPGDALKLALAAATLPLGWRLLGRRRDRSPRGPSGAHPA